MECMFACFGIAVNTCLESWHNLCRDGLELCFAFSWTRHKTHHRRTHHVLTYVVFQMIWWRRIFSLSLIKLLCNPLLRIVSNDVSPMCNLRGLNQEWRWLISSTPKLYILLCCWTQRVVWEQGVLKVQPMSIAIQHTGCLSTPTHHCNSLSPLFPTWAQTSMSNSGPRWKRPVMRNWIPVLKSMCVYTSHRIRACSY